MQLSGLCQQHHVQSADAGAYQTGANYEEFGVSVEPVRTAFTSLSTMRRQTGDRGLAHRQRYRIETVA